MTEIWKELEGFSKYKFSNSGKVWSKTNNRELSRKPREDGYVKSCYILMKEVGWVFIFID